MKFLYGIKNCHSCKYRQTCKVKNHPKTLLPKAKEFEHINRSTMRVFAHDRKLCDQYGHFSKSEITTKPKPPHIKIETFCKNYSPEEKKNET